MNEDQTSWRQENMGMIVDKLESWNRYFTGDDWKIIAEYLASLNNESSEGEYSLKGNDIFARVMCYETRDFSAARLESHRSYIDIQVVLEGGEGIAWHPTDTLEVCDIYDAEKDVEFYSHPAFFPARVDVRPGYFVALFPQDAHMPQLQVSGLPSRLKKAVIKVRTSMYPCKHSEYNNYKPVYCKIQPETIL